MTGVTVFGGIAGQRQLRVRRPSPAAGVPEDSGAAVVVMSRSAANCLSVTLVAGATVKIAGGPGIVRDARIEMNVRPGEGSAGAGDARITMTGRTNLRVQDQVMSKKESVHKKKKTNCLILCRPGP